jgi:methyl acetate hydrolase
MRKPSRRDFFQTTATLAASGYLGISRAAAERADVSPHSEAKKPLHDIDLALRTATSAGDIPGVVALAATDGGVVYEGAFGQRRLNGGPAMTRDTVFRVASMVKLITSVAALQLVEQGKLSLDAPVPNIEPVLGEPQVLEGFDAKGVPHLRPAKRPIHLRDLLTHTAGFTYRLWDEKATRYFMAVDHLPKAARSKACRSPLMFDPGAQWQYGTNIDWVGRIVELVSSERLDNYFRKNIFDPLGMTDTAFVISQRQQAREATVHQRLGNDSLKPEPTEKQAPAQSSFSGGGGIYSTAPDYLTLLRALLQGGSLDGARILRSETVAMMGQNQIGDVDVGVLKTTKPTVSNDVDLFPEVTLKWGFGHMINMQDIPERRSAGSLTWAGLFNTYYWIDPTARIAAVFMTQVLPFVDHRTLRLYRAYERNVYKAVRQS